MRIIKLIDLPFCVMNSPPKRRSVTVILQKAQLSFPATSGSGFVLQELMNSTRHIAAAAVLSGAAIFIFALFKIDEHQSSHDHACGDKDPPTNIGHRVCTKIE